MNIILGGTSGLGRDIARHLQARGEETFVVGRSYSAEKHGAGRKVDLQQREAIEQLIAFVRDLGTTTLKRFFWVSGEGYVGNFADQPGVTEMLYAHVAHSVPVVQAAWQKMVAQTEPTNMVIVSSTTGYKTRTNEAVYGFIKGGQSRFTDDLGAEAARLHNESNSGIKVTLCEPGGMQSPFWDQDNLPPNYENFMKTDAVAAYILDHVFSQNEPSAKLSITPDVL